MVLLFLLFGLILASTSFPVGFVESFQATIITSSLSSLQPTTTTFEQRRTERTPRWTTTTTTSLSSSSWDDYTEDDISSNSDDGVPSPPPRLESKNGKLGQGPNWIERSFPVDVKGDGADSVVFGGGGVEDYNLGVHGESFQTGPLSLRMYEALATRSTLDISNVEISNMLTVYAMDFTAKEAVRAALKQNGMELTLQENQEDVGMWGNVDNIRFFDPKGKKLMGDTFDSFEEAMEYWTPGQAFSFVAWHVPATMSDLSVGNLLEALDPDGTLTETAKSKNIVLPGADIETLHDLACDNHRRVESSPRGAVTEDLAYYGDDSPGYRIISAQTLYDATTTTPSSATDTDDAVIQAIPKRTKMHVMDALVSHGCLIVDLTNQGETFTEAIKLAEMWKAAESCFSNNNRASILPPLQVAHETGSERAMVGYTNMNHAEFVEVRRSRTDGTLLPNELGTVIGPDQSQALQDSFDVVSEISKCVMEIVVAASTEEAEAMSPMGAVAASKALTSELVDDGRSMPSSAVDITHSEGSVSMSPHRLCKYVGTDEQQKEEEVQEVFGAHTDTTFITAVPVAKVSGLEVLDESAEKWLRPEVNARRHWRAARLQKGDDPDAWTDTVDGKEVPWYARYVVLMAGELLQLTSRDEVQAAVHRVVASTSKPRLSAPILMRGRTGTKLSCGRYVGGAGQSKLLRDCDNMMLEDIHDALQYKPPQN